MIHVTHRKETGTVLIVKQVGESFERLHMSLPEAVDLCMRLEAALAESAEAHEVINRDVCGDGGR